MEYGQKIQLSDEEKSNENNRLFASIKETITKLLNKKIKRLQAKNIKVPKLSINEW